MKQQIKTPKIKKIIRILKSPIYSPAHIALRKFIYNLYSNHLNENNKFLEQTL
jgi:hypothetical protein